MVNRVILIGNLGKDPEVRRLEDGTTVAKFSVATSESYKDKSGEWQEKTEWHDVIAWRSLAERAESQLTKGTKVYVEGKLTHRSWQDKDGNNRRTTEVVASYFRIVSKPTQVDGTTYPEQTSAPIAEPPAEGPDDDLPF